MAGISKLQINELKAHGIKTLQSLAGMPLPLDWKPRRGAADSYVRVREQARIIVEARTAGKGRFELLPMEAGFGLARLPEPCDGDIFLDLEGDPFVGEDGLEYLFGYVSKDADGALVYEGNWETWRLHLAICAYTSELFYDGKLRAKEGLERQVIRGAGQIKESGLYFLPVAHSGSHNCSPEEALAVGQLVTAILAGGATWADREGRITLEDIVIFTPYNAQVFEIQHCLPGARAGTVDKFQGQEAPIAIYSTATSTHADAPRGMEVLYRLNRLNVATSRAKCASTLVGSPQIFEAECRSPRQIQLAHVAHHVPSHGFLKHTNRPFPIQTLSV